MQTTSEKPGSDVTTLCYHCGEVCADKSIALEEKYFCCQGCKTVFELLKESNLCNYYALEEHPGNKLAFSTGRSARFEYLNDESVLRQLVEFSDGDISNVTLYLPTVHCTSCIWLLEHLYKLHPGIARSEVNFLKKEISISFKNDRITLSEIAELLTKVGYEPQIHVKDSQKKDQSALRSLYLRVGLAGFAFGNIMLLSFPEYLTHDGGVEEKYAIFFRVLNILLATPVLLYSASGYFTSAWYSLKQKQLNLDVPVVMGVSALFFQSVYDIVTGSGPGYMDSFTGLLFFLLIGKVFQLKTFETLSFDRDYQSYFPLSVTVLKNGEEHTIPVSALTTGTTILVRNRELVPADSILRSGVAYVDYSFVTGESVPVEISGGSQIYAGGRIVGAQAEMEVVKEVSHSYLARLWNNDIFKKEKTSALLKANDIFGKYFTYFVILVASSAAFFWMPDSAMSVKVFTAVLIIACPCALTLAAPFALGSALGAFGKAKFYGKNTGIVADLAEIDTIVFDKTGTLTSTEEGKVEFVGNGFLKEETALLASAFKNSTHPLSRKIAATFKNEKVFKSDMFREVPSHGFTCMIDGRVIAIGSYDWVLNASHIAFKKLETEGSAVYVAIDGEYRGCFIVRNALRDGLEDVFKSLGSRCELYMLSGDNVSDREQMRELFKDDARMHFYQSPEDKMNFIKSLQAHGKKVAMIGDGLNDAGALRQANLGIAIAEDTGSFSPACDAILGADVMARLPQYIKFAKYGVNVVVGMFIFTIFYNALGMTFATTGHLTPLTTAILMPSSTLFIIFGSMGAMKLKARLMGL
ncbi:MAG TPA: heavy metal translocating P-type ATPase metal-binding domain-containing protein [Patescibacteria group bacterium]|nr:heavy metal translocating P-type ATPase metal-binding domain-containing protein [Patescibacteria group bacterium]